MLLLFLALIGLFPAPLLAQSVAMTGPPLARNAQIITDYSFSIAINVLGAPGGARDYVGLFRVADGVRVDWRYVNDSKIRNPNPTGPTAGTVRFSNLAPGDYAARLYRNGSAAQADMIASVLVTVPPRVLRLILSDEEAQPTVTRAVGAAATDVITVKHGDGRETVLEIKKDVSLEVRRGKLLQP